MGCFSSKMESPRIGTAELGVSESPPLVTPFLLVKEPNAAAPNFIDRNFVFQRTEELFYSQDHDSTDGDFPRYGLYANRIMNFTARQAHIRAFTTKPVPIC